jgi:hypothetical protein
MNFKLKLIIFNIIAFSSNPFYVRAQDINKPNGLFNFFQKNADTTVILWDDPFVQKFNPYLKIVSKKQDTIAIYNYRFDLVFGKPQLPKNFDDTLSKIHPYVTRGIEFKKFKSLNVNEFLKPVLSNRKQLTNFWKFLNDLKPWQIPSELPNSSPCPKNDLGFSPKVLDGGPLHIILITKEEVKIITYDSPQAYDKLCPSNIGRAAVVEIDKLFGRHFK